MANKYMQRKTRMSVTFFDDFLDLNHESISYRARSIYIHIYARVAHFYNNLNKYIYNHRSSIK